MIFAAFHAMAVRHLTKNFPESRKSEAVALALMARDGVYPSAGRVNAVLVGYAKL